MPDVANLPRGRDVSFVLSESQAKAMIDRAQKEWGADVDDPSTLRLAIVRLYMGGHNQYVGQRQRQPVGAFHVRWHTPGFDQATIERLEWDPELGSSDEEVCQVINTLAGWRLTR
jgi:hypothetical protein